MVFYYLKEIYGICRIVYYRGGVMVKKGYERVDVTFSKTSDIEMQLYKYIEEKGQLIGKGKYIKQLILEDMKKAHRK